MELLEFKHENDPARNRELFGLLGEYAASSSIREKLGGVSVPSRDASGSSRRSKGNQSG